MSEYFGVKLVSSTHISVGAIKVIDLIDWGGRRWCCIYARGTNYKTSCVLTCANPNEPHYSTPGICLGTLTNNKTSGTRLQFAKLMRHSYMQRGHQCQRNPLAIRSSGVLICSHLFILQQNVCNALIILPSPRLPLLETTFLYNSQNVSF